MEGLRAERVLLVAGAMFADDTDPTVRMFLNIILPKCFSDYHVPHMEDPHSF